MRIIEPEYPWLGKSISTAMAKVDAIVLHHAAGNGMSALEIDTMHRNLNPPYAAIGYHFYVRKDGSIYRGRPEDRAGAHAGASSGYNTHSIGICFEGNYEIEREMPDEQLKAGRELIKDLILHYRTLDILQHKDLTATACLPLDETEVLTPFGFVPLDSLSVGDEVYQYLSEAGTVELTNVIDVVCPHEDKVYRMRDTEAISEDMLRILVINDRAGVYDDN